MSGTYRLGRFQYLCYNSYTLFYERNPLMPEITLTVHHKVGLHARPAASFVQTARQFKSDIKITHGECEANGKSILKVLTLGVNQGAVITIRAEGDDAEKALAALETLIENNFGEVG